jgi:hypothetical protein
MLDEAALGAFLDRAQADLFRIEVLDAYDVASDGGDFHRYLAGEPGPDPARKGAWLDRLKADAERGLRNRRVRVLRSPLTPYLRYECEWGYAYNVTAGEDIRILDLAETDGPAGLIEEEFWVMDGRDVVRMHYDDHGKFTGAEILPSSALPKYRAARDAAWGTAVPFETWWRSHPHYRREGHVVA